MDGRNFFLLFDGATTTNCDIIGLVGTGLVLMNPKRKIGMEIRTSASLLCDARICVVFLYTHPFFRSRFPISTRIEPSWHAVRLSDDERCSNLAMAPLFMFRSKASTTMAIPPTSCINILFDGTYYAMTPLSSATSLVIKQNLEEGA